MSWLKMLDIGLDVANAFISEHNATKLKELQMQGATAAFIEAIIKELRNQIFNYKQTAETILANETESPVIAAGAIKLLERRLADSGITPEVFQELTDKEYTANVIRFIKENSNRMFGNLSENEKTDVIRVASVASRLQDYNFYVENYQKGKDLQKATEVVMTYKNRQGCLPLIGIGLYVYPGIAFPALLAIGLGGNSEAGQTIFGIIGFGLWIWGLVSILKWKNGGEYKKAKKIFEQQHGSDFNLSYFNELEKEFGSVEEIKKRRKEAQRVAGNFFKDSSFFQTSYPNLEIKNDSIVEQDSTSDFEDEQIEITSPTKGTEDVWSSQHITLEDSSESKKDDLSSSHADDTKQSLPIEQSSATNFDIEKTKNTATDSLSVSFNKLKIIFSNLLDKFKELKLSSPKILVNKKQLVWGAVVVTIAVIGVIIFLAIGNTSIFSSLSPTVTPATIRSSPRALIGTPVPFSNTPILLNNLDKFSQLARWGKGNIEDMTFSPDGKLLAVIYSTGIYLYDAETLAEVKFIATDFKIYSVAFSPDGLTLATGTVNNLVYLWAISDGGSSSALTGPRNSSNPTLISVKFSPDGQTIAAGSEGGDIQIWQLQDNSLLYTLKGHIESVLSINFSPNGSILASGGADNTVRLWQTSDGTLLNTLEGHTDIVTDINFSPNGQILASGAFDGSVRLWQISNGSLLQTLEENKDSADSYVSSIDFSPDGAILAVGFLDGTIQQWRVSDATLYKTDKRYTYAERLEKLEFSPDGQNLAVGYWNGTVQLLQASDSVLLRELEGQPNRVRGLDFSPDGQLLAVGYWDSTIQIFRAADGALLNTLQGHTNAVTSIQFSPDGSILASGSWDGTVKLWQVSDGNLLLTLEGHQDRIYSIDFSPDGKILASGSGDDTIKLWMISDGSLLQVIEGHTGDVQSIDFSPDGQILASGAWDGTLRLWQMPNGNLLHILGENTNQSSYINSIDFSPDGTLLAGGYVDGTIRLWKTSDNTLLQTLKTDSINTIKFSPDGQILVSGGSSNLNNRIQVWDVSNGTLLLLLKGHTEDVYSIAFSPDGQILASGAFDSTIMLWGIPSANPVSAVTSSTPNIIPTTYSTPSFTPTPQPSLDKITDDKNVPMSLVPAGEFSMGDTVDKAMKECRKYLDNCQQSWFENHAPPHTIYLDSYYIDTYEVTNARYEECVNARVCVPPKAITSYTHGSYYGDSQFNNYPVINVDWNMAKTYCEWRGAYLPSEAQWEKAARGMDGRSYPWGENLDCTMSNYSNCVGDTSPVGSYINSNSPYGLYDMGGNVSEWVNDWFSESYYQESPSVNPLGADYGQYKVIRGGSWLGVGLYSRTSIRIGLDTTYSDNFIGFRCASNTDSAANNPPPLSSPTPTSITNVTTPTPIVCSNFISQLLPNMEAKVITDAINMREKPGTNQTVVGIIYTGDKVQLSSEPPICGDGYLWWKVKAVKLGVTGWVVEGIAEERWLSP